MNEKGSVSDVRELMYYENTPSGRKLSVCLIVGDDSNPEYAGEILTRGVAICSHRDNFSKKIGRAMARGRAWKAYWLGTYLPVKRKEIITTLPKEIKYKGMTATADDNLKPTFTEMALLSRIPNEAA